jgi:crotonobetainyl-CoA:carnitine CoA-transferase CaiB-like acyl-CoA transferase
MGQPELSGTGKWGKIVDRDRDRIEIDTWVARWTEQFTLAECIAECDKFEVPCGPVYSIADIFTDPQYAARENILRMKDPRVGEIAMPNVVPRLSDTPGKVEWLGPTLGEHNSDVFKGILGLSDGEIGKLKDKGVV